MQTLVMSFVTSLPDPRGGKIISIIFGSVRFQTFITMAFNSRLEDSIEPSILMRSEVRIRANKVAVKVTVPSAFKGIFIATKRCKNPAKIAVGLILLSYSFY